MEGRHVFSNILVWTALFRPEFVRETRKLGRKHWKWEKTSREIPGANASSLFHTLFSLGDSLLTRFTAKSQYRF